MTRPASVQTKAPLISRRPAPKPTILLSLGWIGLVLILGLGAGWIAPYGFDDQSLLDRLHPPVFAGGGWDHVMGTDGLGRDIFSRLVFGTRTSLLIAFAGSVIGAVIGTLAGFAAAHFRGLLRDAIGVLIDFQASMPFLIIVLAVLAFFGNSFRLFLFLIGLHGWETYARLTRGLVLQAEGQGYAGAIRSLGVHPLAIYLRHVLPNISSVLVVQVTLNFPELILLETSLSFLGLGVQPPQTSLGLLLGEGRSYLATAWWLGVPAGMMILFTTLSISLAGDWLRDRLDPALTSAP